MSVQKILSLPVYTESGIKLGKVFDIELDVESQIVLRYLVRPNFISVKYFLIQSAQIKQINEDKIVVEDGISESSLMDRTDAPILEE